MGQPIADTALNALFREARTYFKWLPQPVSDETLRQLYDVLKWAPTSANGAPARFAFLRSREAKERLRPALAPMNVHKVMTAPVTVIIGYDLKFYDHLPKLFPHNTGMADAVSKQARAGRIHRTPEFQLAGRVFDPCGASARPRLRSVVRFRSSEGG